MLSRHDSDLSERDPALPGLGTILDPEALGSALRAALPPAHITALEPAYVRYKPGMNCLVAYTLHLANGTVELYAKAYRSEAHDQLRKPFERPGAPVRVAGTALPARLLLGDKAIVVSFFPNDSELKTLASLAEPGAWRSVMSRIAAKRPDLWEAGVRSIRYKPERRYVAQLFTEAGPQAVIKVYTENGYPSARLNSRAFKSRDLLRVPGRIGHSSRRGLLAFEWMEGRLLSEELADPGLDLAAIERVGAALGEGHSQETNGLPHLTREAEASSLLAVAAGLAFLHPRMGEVISRLAGKIAAHLVELPPVCQPIHGDFYAKQVLLSDDHVVILDFDSAAVGDPAADLGLFIAHLEEGVLRRTLPRGVVALTGEALLAGYERTHGRVARGRLELYVAASLLRLAPHSFRNRYADWPEEIEAVVARAEAIFNRASHGKARQSTMSDRGYVGREHLEARRLTAPAPAVPVSDPFGAGDDPSMPFVAQALNPQVVQRLFKQRLPQLGEMELSSIRVVRHKQGRRCLIEYDLEARGEGAARQRFTLSGKARARGLDEATYRTLESLWKGGFQEGSPDGICIPEPVGVVPELQMWLYRKVDGVPATHLLAGPGGAALARRIAEAVNKLHRSGVKAHRRHTMADELRILHERLPQVAALRPEWGGRIGKVLRACDRLGASVPRAEQTGIHRDFYADNLIVNGSRLYLLDFDLYCEGDPGVDTGNFVGHVKEYSLRTWGDPDRLSEVEAALEERFVELAGAKARSAIKAYTTLTLVRHIHLSTLFEQRRHLTEMLLGVCEERLAGALRSPTVPPARAGWLLRQEAV